MEKKIKNTRNVNIELLRNLAMLFVVILHLLGKTGAKDELMPGTPIWLLTWALYAVCIMGNNIFIIISGYFWIENRFKFHKLINMWFSVWVYSVGITLIAKYVLGLELVSGFRNVLFPVVKGEYWFITVYIGLYCFTPYIRQLVEHITIKMHGILLLVCMLFFSVIPTGFQLKGWLNSGGANGIVWFVFLYLLGAYIRKYNLMSVKWLSFAKKWMWCLLILLLPLFRLVLELLRNKDIEHYLLDGYLNSLHNENSLIVLVASVALVICFMSITIKNAMVSKAITYLGSGCMGVYLIHNNRNISHFLWEKLRINYWLVERENLFVIILIAVTVFFVCNLIEHLRQYIFKVLKVEELIFAISSKITERIQL